ncbi:hypothetical protein BDW66DRAFT_151871 [Aspergillus desertorum]
MAPFPIKPAKEDQPQADQPKMAGLPKPEQPTYKKRAQLTQMFPPCPTFTEKDIAFQKGRVFLVTGGTSGIGFELAKILYARGGTVYITGRTEEKAKEAVQKIQASVAERDGQVDYIVLNLDDLTSIRQSAEAFMEKESRLDVLWNNAGVAQPPVGVLSKQGLELHLATNCLGPFLFTQMMLPLLDAGVALNGPAYPGSVRVIWLSDQVVELSSPLEGIIMQELDTPPQDNSRNYLNSKTGALFLATEFARRYGPEHGIISVAMNPGAARTNLLRHTKWTKFIHWPLLHSPKLAALTELYAGLSPDINLENNGCYVIPWGRIHTTIAPHLMDAMRPKEAGGTGKAQQFWDFCDDKTKDYH